MSNYNRIQTNGYRSLQPLDNMQIMRIAPSVFAEDKHESRSHRYGYIKSSEILIALRNEGFEPYLAQEATARKDDKHGFTKHMLRFRHRSQLGQTAVRGTEVFEIIFVNSHDGSSCVELYGGYFVYACSNGLLVGDTCIAQKYKHSGLQLDSVIEGSYTILNEKEQIDYTKENMQETLLSREGQYELAAEFRALRWDKEEAQPTLANLLAPRRQEDVGNSVWKTYNVLQENLVSGGLRKDFNVDRNSTIQRTRPIYNITQTVSLNRNMWDIADRTALMHQGVL